MAAVRMGHPLGTRESDLPPNLALAAKLLVLCLLPQGIPTQFPDIFLPFHPLFDLIQPLGVFKPTMRAIFLLGFVLLFVTRRTRAACLLIGLSVLTAIFGSKQFFSNGKTYWCCLLILLGLYSPRDGVFFLRAQFAVMYGGCFLSKILDADWRSGRYFDNWMTMRLEHGGYRLVSSFLPELLVARFMSWSVIVLEGLTTVLFALPGTLRAAVWMTILLHGGILIILWGNTFGEFYYGVMIGLLAFVDWPKGRMSLAYVPGRRLVDKLVEIVRWADWDDAWRVKELPAPSAGSARPFLTVELDGKSFADFAAFKRVVLFTPFFHYAMLALVLPSRLIRPFPIIAAMLLFFPPLEAALATLFRRALSGPEAGPRTAPQGA